MVTFSATMLNVASTIGNPKALPKNGSNNAIAQNMNMTDRPDLEIETLRAENQRLKEQHAFMTQALQGSDAALLNQIDEHQKAKMNNPAASCGVSTREPQFVTWRATGNRTRRD